ncbi:helicase-exonuclease AddAB subunit AddB [Gorillibacterium sp. sgz5001074]|uniref:helicase-exonuclease AddAB subunit AddB n=1 Tax=Gorillibacterium sp. sgz5001074 TaxID=3446695 RepID=UPI003F67578E
MGIRYLIGRAGSGKSTRCLEELRERLLREPDGPPLVLLVPEQATFQAEFALVTTPGIHGLLRAQVLSFRRLAWRVMQETGGTAGTPIDDLGKKMLLHKLLHQHNGNLRMFRGAHEKMGFVENLHALFSELQRYRVGPSDLEAHASKLEGKVPEHATAVADKLEELLPVYRDYEEILTQEYLDGDRFLTLLAERAGDCPWIREAEVWIDGFNGFTPQEQAVVESLMEHAARTTLTLTLNRPYAAGEEPHELDLFHPTATTMRKLQETVRDRNLPEPEVEILKEPVPPRFLANPMLGHLERQYEYRLTAARKGYLPAGGEVPAVAIHAAANRRAEVEGAAREIVGLVRDGGLRYRDIALRVRNIEDYGDLLETVFADYGIPYFMDQKRSVLNHPLVELIRSALEAVIRNWPYDAVFRCVKTEFFLPVEEEAEASGAVERADLDRLENYVLQYGIHGHRWLDPRSWELRRQVSLEEDGTGEGALTAAEREASRRLTAAATAVTEPLKRLQDGLRRAGTLTEMAEALFAMLEELRVPEKLDRWSAACIASGRPEKAREHAQMWELVMEVLDQMTGLLGGEDVKPELFAKLMDTGLESLRLGLVPPAMDQVLIGSIDRTRSAQVKVAYVLGVNDGVLPKKMKDDGIIAENEREFLLAQGVPMADSSRRKLLDEQYLIYTVLCAPSDRLWISYPLADEEGKTLLPSEVVKQVKSLLPTLKEGMLLQEPDPGAPDAEQKEYVVRPGRTVSRLVVQLKHLLKGTAVSPVWTDVYQWFVTRPAMRELLWTPSRSLFYSNAEAPLTDEVSLKLYGERLRASVSRMERYVACPFSQFASHGLKLAERRIYRLEAPDIGQLYHAALSGLAKQLSEEGRHWGSVTEEEWMMRVNRIVDELSPRLQHEILSSTPRYQYMAHKLKGIIGKTSAVLAEHARKGEFVPVGLEVGFGPGEALPSLTLPLPNGRTMELIGRIDRVDRAYGDKGMLLRIIDYKSSPTALRLAELYHGLSLQMLTYLDVVLTHAVRWLGEPAKPAGVLYFHVHNPLLSVKNKPDPLQAQAAVRKQFKTKGLVSSDLETVLLMDGSLKEKGGHSELIPVSVKNDGTFYKSASVATDGQWDRLRSHVRGAVKQIGTEITGGRVAVEPYRMGKKTACTFCSYKAVCQYDPLFDGNAPRPMRAYGKDEVWLALDEAASEAEGARKDGGTDDEPDGRR